MGVWIRFLIKKYDYSIFGIFFGTSRFGTGTVLVVPNFFWAQFMVPVTYRVLGVGTGSIPGIGSTCLSQNTTHPLNITCIYVYLLQ